VFDAPFSCRRRSEDARVPLRHRQVTARCECGLLIPEIEKAAEVRTWAAFTRELHGKTAQDVPSNRMLSALRGRDVPQYPVAACRTPSPDSIALKRHLSSVLCLVQMVWPKTFMMTRSLCMSFGVSRNEIKKMQVHLYENDVASVMIRVTSQRHHSFKFVCSLRGWCNKVGRDQ
jgi:hypothetical protein